MALIKLPGQAEREVHLTIPAPICEVCNEEVEQWEVHYTPIFGTDDEWIELVVTCHGQQRVTKFRKSEVNQIEHRLAFKEEAAQAQKLFMDLAKSQGINRDMRRQLMRKAQ